jgi:hypothetical protein
MSRPTLLVMPAPNSFGQLQLETPNSVVIVGANGSGKTRLGAWFEFTSGQQAIIHRVAAQRSLVLPDSVSSYNVADAEFGFRNGIKSYSYSQENFISLRQNAATQGTQQFKRNNKWQQQPATSQQDDYGSLLILLFSEENEANSKIAQQVRTGQTPIALDTKLQRIKRMWESILPHRQLIISANAISVQPVGPIVGGAYKASEMSDGERVALYLMGQCLTAPTDSIIVADEPEVHLHRIIQTSLWNAIEKERPDCLFVYLTHDLDFAASRNAAKKIWIRNYTGQVWDWQEVPAESEGLPEEVLLAVLGSRRPVLFTEGDRGGAEQAIFSHLYQGWTIMPRGGCEEVIQATKAFRALGHLHGIESHGIVDLDYRSPQEKTALEAVGVHVLETQEIENLLLIEPVLTLVATHAHTHGLVADVPVDIVRKVKEFAFGALARDRDLLASRKTAWQLEQQLHKIDRSVIGITALEHVRTRAAQFDVAGTYTAFLQEIDHIISSQDYAKLLAFYNNKGLARQVGRFFGTLSYPELVKRLISNGQGGAIIVALRTAAPQLPIAALAPS